MAHNMSSYFNFKKIFLSSLVSLNFIFVISQQNETPVRIYMRIDAGTHLYSTSMIKPHQIREMNTSYSYDQDNIFFFGGNLNNYRNKTAYYFGVKPEFQIIDRLSISSGLRFSIIRDKIDANKNYFLWQLPSNTNNANYLRINEIKQNIYTIGMPLELRFYPKKRDVFVRQYFILGGVLNFASFSKTDIIFDDINMEKYDQDIQKDLTKPDMFSYYIYLGVGLKIGKADHVSGNIELFFPMLSRRNSRITSFSQATSANLYGSMMIGINASIKIPVKINKNKDVTQQ